MIGRQVKQINRLRLALGPDGLYRVYTPDRTTCLEEFGARSRAEAWMETVTDYTTRQPQSRRN